MKKNWCRAVSRAGAQMGRICFALFCIRVGGDARQVQAAPAESKVKRVDYHARVICLQPTEGKLCPVEVWVWDEANKKPLPSPIPLLIGDQVSIKAENVEPFNTPPEKGGWIVKTVWQYHKDGKKGHWLFGGGRSPETKHPWDGKALSIGQPDSFELELRQLPGVTARKRFAGGAAEVKFTALGPVRDLRSKFLGQINLQAAAEPSADTKKAYEPADFHLQPAGTKAEIGVKALQPLVNLTITIDRVMPR